MKFDLFDKVSISELRWYNFLRSSNTYVYSRFHRFFNACTMLPISMIFVRAERKAASAAKEGDAMETSDA